MVPGDRCVVASGGRKEAAIMDDTELYTKLLGIMPR